MLGGGNLFVENRNTDRLDILPRLVKRRNVQKRMHIDAVPSEKDHCSRKLFSSLLQSGDKILLFCDFKQPFHLVLIRGWQIFQPIDAFVDVGQRQQIQQGIEWGKNPSPESVADEITPQRR